jgi:hypothetical protein
VSGASEHRIASGEELWTAARLVSEDQCLRMTTCVGPETIEDEPPEFNAIFEYIEVFHNRRRRHSSLGMLTPIEFELNKINTTTQAA